MAYVRQARVERNKNIIIAALGLAIILIALAISILIANGTRQSEKKIDLPLKAEQAKQVNVIRANTRIQAGEPADISKFEMVTVPKELVPDTAVTTIQFLKGKRVASNIEKSEFLLQSNLVESNAWYEDGDRLIEHTFQDGAIPSIVEVGSVVDIKLFKQGAEDAIVVPKVAVVGKNQNTLSFYLNLTEQEYLKEAATESGLLFLVVYLDETQPAAGVTYIPKYSRSGKASVSAEDVKNAVKNFAKAPDLN